MSTHSQLETVVAARLSRRVGAPGRPARRADAWPRGAGRKPRVPLTQVLPALTFHVMQDAGTLAEHLFQLFRTPLADSSWSDRRLRLPWEIFAELMRRALRPARDAAPAPRGVLAGLALGRPRRHAVQSDQHAAGHGDRQESPHAPGPRGLRQDHDRGPVGNRAAQSAGRGGRPQGRIGVGAGPAAAGAAAEAGRCCWAIGCMASSPLRAWRTRRAGASAAISCCAPPGRSSRA